MYERIIPVHRAGYVTRGLYVTFILTLSAQCKQRQEILGEGEGEGHVASLKPSFPATGRKLIGQGNTHVTGFRRHFRFTGISETKGLMVTSCNKGSCRKRSKQAER